MEITVDGAVFAAAGCLIGGPSLLVMLGKHEVRVRMKFFFVWFRYLRE